MENLPIMKDVRDTKKVWEESIDIIRKTFCQELTPMEFEIYRGLATSLGANPFLREIYAFKIKNQLKIFCGRDFYRRKAQEQSDYNGHYAEVVCENDTFTVENGKPKHSFGLKDRGKIIGAYAVLWRKGIDNPFFIFVKIKEYAQKFWDDKKKTWDYNKIWKEKPETMIKKVAESQVLRMGYQGIFANTYDISEKWDDYESENEIIYEDKKETENENVPDNTKQTENRQDKTKAFLKIKREVEKDIERIEDKKEKDKIEGQFAMVLAIADIENRLERIEILQKSIKQQIEKAKNKENKNEKSARELRKLAQEIKDKKEYEEVLLAINEAVMIPDNRSRMDAMQRLRESILRKIDNQNNPVKLDDDIPF